MASLRGEIMSAIMGRPPKKVNMDKVIEAFLAGATMRQISADTGVCYTTISRRLKKKWLALGLVSLEDYRSYLLQKKRRNSLQEIIIKRDEFFITYIVVGKKVRKERRKRKPYL